MIWYRYPLWYTVSFDKEDKNPLISFTTQKLSKQAHKLKARVKFLAFTFCESVITIITTIKDLFISPLLYSTHFMPINRNKPDRIPQVISPERTAGSHCFSNVTSVPKNLIA